MVLIPAGIGPPFSKIPSDFPVDFICTGDFFIPRFGFGADHGCFEAGFFAAVLANLERTTRPELSIFFGTFLMKH
jgi:hypothetical protein